MVFDNRTDDIAGKRKNKSRILFDNGTEKILQGKMVFYNGTDKYCRKKLCSIIEQMILQ